MGGPPAPSGIKIKKKSSSGGGRARPPPKKPQMTIQQQIRAAKGKKLKKVSERKERAPIEDPNNQEDVMAAALKAKMAAIKLVTQGDDESGDDSDSDWSD